MRATANTTCSGNCCCCGGTVLTLTSFDCALLVAVVSVLTRCLSSDLVVRRSCWYFSTSSFSRLISAFASASSFLLLPVSAVLETTLPVETGAMEVLADAGFATAGCCCGTADTWTGGSDSVDDCFDSFGV